MRRRRFATRLSSGTRGASLWRVLNARADEASRLGVYLSAAFLLTVAVYGAALGGHLAAWQHTLTARAEAALIAGGFGINEVILKGGVHTPGAQVNEALRTVRARTIFGYDTRAAKLRLENVGWVESARVMRLWPSTLVVELREREPFARWAGRASFSARSRQISLICHASRAKARTLPQPICLRRWLSTRRRRAGWCSPSA